MNQQKFIENNFGYCCYENNFEMPSGEIIAIIYNLYVYPQYRKQGNAKKLLQMVIEKIKQINPEIIIYIEAIPREDSISLDDLISFYKSMNLVIY